MGFLFIKDIYIIDLMTPTQKLNDEIFMIERALEAGRLEDAERMLGRILKLAPKNPRANELFAYFLGASGESCKAFEQLKIACGLEGALPSALHELGCQYLYASQYDSAINYLEAALKRNGPFIGGLHDLGIAYALTGALQKAREAFENAYRLDPRSAEVVYNLGKVYDDLGMAKDAVKCYYDAVSIDPKMTSALINLGDVNVDLTHYEEAISNYDAALAVDSSLSDALVNRGVAFHIMKKFEDALSSFDQAILIDKNCAGAHFNKALTLVSLERYQEGWKEYEWRWAYERFTSPPRSFMSLLWLGHEELNGKSILVHSEQGLGDTIQFCRYLPMLSRRADSIFVEVEEPLISTIKSMNLGIKVFKKGSAIPAHDYHCPMMSLPLALQSYECRPPFPDKYLSANRELVSQWKARLGSIDIPRIGIVWRGSATHQNDRNRSIALRDLMTVMPEGCQYLSLQKDPTQDERALLASNPMYLDYSNDINDFQDTAALMDCLDLVVGVDTSTIHLSAATGIQTWLLLSYVQDWRWPPDGGQSPWYSSMRILRQSADQEWRPVLNHLESEILRFIEAHPKNSTKKYE